jgi:hypothetical protein
MEIDIHREHVPRLNALTVFNHFEGIEKPLHVKSYGNKSKRIAMQVR